MGLELVTIIVRVEEAFGISISDTEAVGLTTTRELANFVAAKVGVTDDPSCLSQQAFYFLREQLGQRFLVSRSEFVPDTKLENTVPREDRIENWTALREGMGKHALPDLARPIWLFWTLAAVVLFGFVYSTSSLIGTTHPVLAVALGALAATGIGCLSAVATRPYKQNFRRRIQNVRQLVSFIVRNEPHVFKRGQRAWTGEQILNIVRTIVRDEGGIVKFSDDDRFIEDLNLG
jgi:hypothetical protein